MKTPPGKTHSLWMEVGQPQGQKALREGLAQ